MFIPAPCSCIVKPGPPTSVGLSCAGSLWYRKAEKERKLSVAQSRANGVNIIDRPLFWHSQAEYTKWLAVYGAKRMTK